ncbi:pseudouridine synthase [Pseudoalteromonas sp. A25]|uniref:pseudouridine synthase n=1 Tax=Pseudoalteromonas sp. A25 TaxID=116092 RepID=UPI001260BC0B|nr:pseudouridine synthase [Pseudoalteromonas sp. A25]
MIQPMRLAKYLSHAGVCSRRQASRLIDSGDVIVNGRPANHIDHVSEQDEILVLGKKVCGPAAKVLYAYHKPVGIDCKLKPDDPSSLLHHLPTSQRVYPIGRLDKDSRGLLLLTNDGELCQRLIHPDHHVEKEYWVKVDRPLDAEFCQKMASGVPVDGQITLPCQVSLLDATRFKIVLKQGLNRQIRKMAKYCGYKVIDLYRVRIAHFTLPNTLPEDEYQPINVTSLKLD